MVFTRSPRKQKTDSWQNSLDHPLICSNSLLESVLFLVQYRSKEICRFFYATQIIVTFYDSVYTPRGSFT